MTTEVQKLVFEALRLGRDMRKKQKLYWVTRQHEHLIESKKAEAAFDKALDTAAWAVKNGMPPPKQASLFD